MKAFAVLLLLLASTAVQGRKLLADDGCADLSILDSQPTFSDAVKIIKGLGLLPTGLISGTTMFLPTNEAVGKMLASPLLPVQGLTLDQLLGMADMFGPQLVSTLLYHIVPSDTYTVEELAQEDIIRTALPDYSFELFEDQALPGRYEIKDGAGQTAVVLGNQPVKLCGAYIYPLDTLLLPAPLADIPRTTVEEAIAILTGGGMSPAPM